MTGPGTVGPVLAALADPTRRLLLERLSMMGETTATVLAEQLPVSRQAIVKHLAVLDQVGLVRGHRAGREQRYTVTPRQLLETARWMNQVAAQWNTRLSAIKQIAESPDEN